MRKLLFTPITLLLCSAFIGCSEDSPLPEPEPEEEPYYPPVCSVYWPITGKITNDENSGYNVLGAEEFDDNQYLAVVPDTIDWLPLGATVTVNTLSMEQHDPDKWINGIRYVFPIYVKYGLVVHEAPTSTDTE